MPIFIMNFDLEPKRITNLFRPLITNLFQKNIIYVNKYPLVTCS